MTTRRGMTDWLIGSIATYFRGAPSFSRIYTIIVAILAFPLFGCRQSDGDFYPPYKAANFCKEENRRIPDAELKGRLLLGMSEVRHGASKLPDEIRDYLSRSAPDGGRESRLHALNRYVQENPGCCWFDDNDLKYRSNPIYLPWFAPGPSPHIADADFDVVGEYVSKGYFSNFYIYDYSKNYYPGTPPNNSKSLRRRGINRVVGASNCGNIFEKN